MNKNDFWLLFKKTGKIEYYLQYKNAKDSVSTNDQENRRNYR